MPSISYRVNQRKFDDAASRYLTEVPLELKDAITLRIRRLLIRIRRFLPPKSAKQGKTRIGIDLTTAALPMNPANMTNPTVRRILQQRDLPALQTITDKSRHPKMIGRTAVLFTDRLHEDARNRKGRVDTTKRLIIPNWKDWRDRLREVSKHVGKLKGSILFALLRVGGAVPAWLSRHGALAEIVDKRRDKKNPSFIVTSRLSWSGFYQWTVSAAYRAETKSMMSDLRRRLKHAAKRSGF